MCLGIESYTNFRYNRDIVGIHTFLCKEGSTLMSRIKCAERKHSYNHTKYLESNTHERVRFGFIITDEDSAISPAKLWLTVW